MVDRALIETVGTVESLVIVLKASTALLPATSSMFAVTEIFPSLSVETS